MKNPSGTSVASRQGGHLRSAVAPTVWISVPLSGNVSNVLNKNMNYYILLDLLHINLQVRLPIPKPIYPKNTTQADKRTTLTSSTSKHHTNQNKTKPQNSKTKSHINLTTNKAQTIPHQHIPIPFPLPLPPTH